MSDLVPFPKVMCVISSVPGKASGSCKPYTGPHMFYRFKTPHLLLLFQFLSKEHRTSKSGMLNKPVQRLPPSYARSSGGVVPATLPFTGWEPHLNLRQHSTGNPASLLYSVIPPMDVRHLSYFWLSAAEVIHLAVGISVAMDLWKSLFLVIAVGIHPRRGTWISCVCQLSWSIMATWRTKWGKCPSSYWNDTISDWQLS